MSISLIQKANIVAGVPERWKKQYSRPNEDPDKQAITAALQALKGSAFTAEQVDAIIGNDSWTDNDCTECGQDFPTLVRIGEEPDYEAQWVDLCPNCLAKAVEALSHISSPNGVSQ